MPANPAYTQYKNRLLYLSLVIDALGMLSYLIPGIGEWTDVIMAVITAFAIYKNFHSASWAAFGFLEEIIPFTDVIPSATMVWVYRFVVLGKETQADFEKGRLL